MLLFLWWSPGFQIGLWRSSSTVASNMTPCLVNPKMWQVRWWLGTWGQEWTDRQHPLAKWMDPAAGSPQLWPLLTDIRFVVTSLLKTYFISFLTDMFQTSFTFKSQVINTTAWLDGQWKVKQLSMIVHFSGSLSMLSYFIIQHLNLIYEKTLKIKYGWSDQTLCHLKENIRSYL